MDCGVSTADSFKDLTLKFSTTEVVEAFDLLNEEDRSTQEWFLMFSLKDLTKDCQRNGRLRRSLDTQQNNNGKTPSPIA